VKHLTIPVSDDYQAVAERVARGLGVARIHLDLSYWRRSKDAQASARNLPLEITD